MLLSQKASEAEQEITRIRLNNMKTEEEKVHLERKTREAELLTERLVQESERRAVEADKLKDELLRARLAEKEAKEKLLEFLSKNAYAITPVPNLFPSTQVFFLFIETLSMGFPILLISRFYRPIFRLICRHCSSRANLCPRI